MMIWSALFTVLVAALLIITVSYCSAENVYCVTPTTTSCSSCPHDSTHRATLSEYAQEAELYFTSNTTMVFLPGDHVLDTKVTVANVARLTMRGGSSSSNMATVVRSGSVGFVFISMEELKIYSLAFTSCSRNYNYGTPGAIKYALFFYSTQYAELVDCSFHDNLGTALVVINTNITLTGNSEFTHNRCVSCSEGSVITAVSSNLTFAGNTTFLENYGPYSNTSGCGTVYASGNVVLSFSGTSNFINNLAHEGGTIFALENVVLSFSGTSNFINNLAHEGGAIFAASNVALSFNGATNFVGNTASSHGGAIFTLGSVTLYFKGNTNFVDNSAVHGHSTGGAIATSLNTVLSFDGTNNFISNSASSLGGAIFTLSNVTLNFSGTSNFVNNSADYDIGNGGAICTSYNTVLSFSGNSNFISNSAVRYGGTMYTSDTKLSFNGTSNFINNSAVDGGAIFTYFNTALIFNGTINFSNNGHIRSGIDLMKEGDTHGGGVFMWLKCASSFCLKQMCIG